MNHFVNKDSPIVIGGVGGSGTRVVAQMMSEAGVYIGDLLNEPNDNLWFTLLFRRPWLLNDENEKQQLKLSEIFRKRMFNEKISFSEKLKVRIAEFEFVLKKYIRSKDWYSLPNKISKSLRSFSSTDSEKKYWGWKEPNSHIYISLLAKKFPEMKFLLVMRNGLDMAFSSNQIQLRNFGNHFGLKGNSPADSLEYWIRANTKAIDTGKKLLGENFKLLRLEDLCASPEKETRELLKWSGIEFNEEMIRKLSALPKFPSSLNRYQKENLNIFSSSQLKSVTAFGYQIHQ